VSQTQPSESAHRPSPAFARAEPNALSSLVYRSRSVAPLTDYELYELVQAAQSRNEVESITGLMLYDDGRFYQWLEGPAENVARVMRSIAGDKRHTDIEILSDKPAKARQFGDWSMRLATRGPRSIHSGHNVVVPSNAAIEDIRQHPEHIKVVLAGFSEVLEVNPQAPHAPSNGPLLGEASALLKNVIVSAVLPELSVRHAVDAKRGAWPIGQRARALADLLIGLDSEAAYEFLRTLQHEDGSVRHLYESVVEPAARMLGNLWTADVCSELDVTLGLGVLQRALRRLNEETMHPITPAGLILPAVLIVPEPGEVHVINAALDSDALWNAGWDPLSEFPVSDEALQDMVAGSWFDALDLSLSASFRRDHWLPRVEKTIALARHASQNPSLVVVVGGRIFVEDQAAGRQVGADGISTTAMHAEQAILDGLNRLKPC
jgi:methanogenic corrinoid protein MtbC1